MRLEKYHLALAIIFGLITMAHTAGADQTGQLAFNKVGAFVLSEDTPIQKGSKKLHELIGYLPVGTICLFDPDQEREVFNHDQAKYESYRAVTTELGHIGLVRADLLQPLVNDSFLVAVGDRNAIPLVSAGSTRRQAPKVSSFSRTSGVFLRVIANADPEFFDVETTWNCEPNCLKAKMRRTWQETGEVRLITPQDRFSEFHLLDQSRPKLAINEIAQKIAKKISKEAEDVAKLLTNLDSINCALGSQGTADLAFKIFGAGFGLNFSINILEGGRLYRIGFILYGGSEAKRKFLWIKDVVCKTNRPYRLETLVLQDIPLDPNHQISIHLDDLPDTLKGDWKPSFWHNSARDKMLRIDGHYAYGQMVQFFEDELSAGGGFASQLSLKERRIFVTLILKKLAYFTSKGF
jgi:hypothetical protein